MDRTWPIWGAVGAASFVGSVILLLPPTQTKASWTSARYEEPARVYDRPQPAVSITPVAHIRIAPHQDRFESARSDDDEAAIPDAGTSQEIAMADQDQAYSDGYAWASQSDVQDKRECRRLSGPGQQGCRDYVASLAEDERASAESALN